MASEGLTLTEANQVVFVNRWWNPSTNSQAVDRVVRIGQHNPVRLKPSGGSPGTQSTDLDIGAARLAAIEDNLNLMPRKLHHWDSPHSVYAALSRNDR